MPLASLPWYDFEEIRPATDALWRRLAANLRKAGLGDRVPSSLNRDLPYERQWTSREMLFGQACGYDVLIAYQSDLQIVATPKYSAPGCEGPYYSSLVVVHEDAQYERLEQLQGTRCVINTPTSHSGMNILRAMVAPLHCEGRFFGSLRISGSHHLSLSLIRRGQADVAAIDCVTYTLLSMYCPKAIDGTRVICRTPCVPAPPYVTGARLSETMLDTLRKVVADTLEEPGLRMVKEELLLDGVEHLPLEAYRPIADFEHEALNQGYCEMQDLLAETA